VETEKKYARVAVILIAMIVWVIYAFVVVSNAQAHTLPMSDVRRGIQEAVEDRMAPTPVIVSLRNCVRTDRHGGECDVIAYTVPGRVRWCGHGWARLLGPKTDYMRARGTIGPCDGPKGKRAPAA
jgi:hypothetical protein